MKLVIEIEQANENATPVVRVLVDDKPLGGLEALELLVKADNPTPKMMVRLPNLSTLGPHLPAETRAALAPILQSIGQAKKALSFFRWIDLP